MSATLHHAGWGRETSIAAAVALAALALVFWLPSSTPAALAPAAAPAETGAGPASSTGPASAPGTVRAVFFWLQTCPHCHAVRTEVLPPLQRRYGAQLQIHEIEVGTAEKWERMVQAAAAYGIPRQQVGVPLLIVGNRALIGSAQIPAELPRLIEQHLAGGGVDFPRLASLQALLPSGPPGPPAPPAPISPPGAAGAAGAVSSLLVACYSWSDG